MIGGYQAGKQQLPRLLHISIARTQPQAPPAGQPTVFLVTAHEEGTGLTWRNDVVVCPDTEATLLAGTQELLAWSRGPQGDAASARSLCTSVGRLLFDTFIGDAGQRFLDNNATMVGSDGKPTRDWQRPTAFLLDVDETTLDLPWELIASAAGPLVLTEPFGRLVSTRSLPKPRRSPISEDATLRILVVDNPTEDLVLSEVEVDAVRGVAGEYPGFDVVVDVLSNADATHDGLSQRLADGDYDTLHFSGHGSFRTDRRPGGRLWLADGPLDEAAIMRLPWRAPPYLVFNSACQSAVGAADQRLVGDGGQGNGVAAAFLAAGCLAHAGYFWPVSEEGAAAFAQTFYRSLFMRENVGLAFLEARRRLSQLHEQSGDLTVFSAVLYGDAGSAHRQDLAMAAR